MNSLTAIRVAQSGELPELQDIPGTLFVAIEDQKITGHVAVRFIEGLAWITDLKVWGTDPLAAAQLCSRARRAIKDQKFSEYLLAIDPEHPALFESLMERGHVVNQVILKGRVS